MFNPNAQTQSNNTNNGGIPENKKACGFVNIYATTASGSRKKIGTIALKKADVREKALADALSKDVDGELLRKFVSKLQFEFNPFDENNAAEDLFDLS